MKSHKHIYKKKNIFKLKNQLCLYIACYIQINFTFSVKLQTVFQHLCGVYFTSLKEQKTQVSISYLYFKRRKDRDGLHLVHKPKITFPLAFLFR